jgi:hypothetical protein
MVCYAIPCPVTDLFCKVVKHGDVSPSDHILSLEATDDLELGVLLGIWLLASSVLLVDGTEQLFEHDKVYSALEIVNLDVGEFWVDTEGQVGGEGVWGGGPCEEAGGGVIDQREGYSDWIVSDTSTRCG